MFPSQLRKYFRTDFVPIIIEYASELDCLFERYDRVVFVARRSMSLFDALVSTGFVSGDPQCKRVLSSRALTYASCCLEGLSVAVVDDVMVKGESLRAAFFAASSHADSCAGLLAARYTECPIDEGALDGRLHVLRSLKESDLYELTREINDFVQCAGITNNIDQPEFEVSLPKGKDLRDILDGHHWFETTTHIQAESGFVGATITYDAGKLPRSLSESLTGYEDALAKVRIVSKVGSGKALLLPFVVLPALTAAQVDALYDSFVQKGLEADASRVVEGHSADGEETRNRLRIVQYLLSWQLGCAVLDTLEYESDLVRVEREAMLFGSRVTTPQLIEALQTPGCKYAELEMRGSKLSDYEVLMQRVRMRFVQKDLCCSYDDDGRSLFVTVEKLFKVVDELGGEGRNSLGIRAVASVSLDYMIDCGILVPFIRSDDSGRIIRAYKSGEIERLSKRQMYMFSRVVCRCMEKLKVGSIQCTTLNRLGVLFAREIKNLRVANSNDEASLFTFAYAEGDGLRRTRDFQPGQTRVIAEMLVRAKLLEWGNPSRTSVKHPEPSGTARACISLSEEEEQLIELVARRFKNYLRKSTDEFSGDKLLDALVMYGSSRYVLGKVGDALAEALGALGEMINCAVLGETVESDFLGSDANALLNVCAWANGNKSAHGAMTLSQEFDAVAARLADTYMKLELKQIICDSYMGEADNALASQIIGQVSDYARLISSLDECSEWLPAARRLACFGAVLSEKMRILLSPHATFEQVFSLYESRIGIIACASDSEGTATLSKAYSVYPLLDNGATTFELDTFMSKHKMGSQFTLTIVFDADHANPYDLMWLGEYQAWDPVGAAERLSKVYSVGMRRAVKVLVEKYAKVGANRVALCYRSEEERSTDDLKSCLHMASEKRPYLSPELDVDEAVASLFEEYGTKIMVCEVSS